MSRDHAAGSAGELFPDIERQREITLELVSRLLDDLRDLPEAPVLDVASHQEILQRLDEELPRRGHGVEPTLERFWQLVRPAMTRVDHPRFHGFIPSPSSFPASLGQLIAGMTNPFVGSWLGGASVAALELIVLRWIAEAVGYPATSGLLTSGGSIANLNACVAAREAALAAHPELTTGQLIDRARVYAGDQVHDSMLKAARVAGLPKSALRVVASGDGLVLDAAAARAAIAEDVAQGALPILLCATAGATNTGAVDPIDELATLCAEQRIWLHVDGAYGGFGALAPSARGLFRGLERADSLTLDPHKWLYSPMGHGCFLTRDHVALARAFETGGDYLLDVPREQVNFFDRGPELSRPGRALTLWLLLRSVGTEALAARIEEDLRLARVAERLLRASGRFEILAPTTLSVVSFAVRGDLASDAEAATRAVYRETLEAAETMVSTTRLRGRLALRLVVLSPRTDDGQVERSVAELVRAADRARDN